MKNYKYLIVYCIAGFIPAIPCLLFALWGKFAPLMVIIVFQILAHYGVGRIFKKKFPELKVSARDLIYWAVIIPIIAYLSNNWADRTLFESAIVYVVFQVILNGFSFWIFNIRIFKKM